MLPETSSMTMSRMGCGVLSKSVIGCGLPSSRTSKSSAVERRDEPAVSIGHGGEDADDVAAAAKNRLLPDGNRRVRQTENTHGECREREEPGHAHYSTIRQVGTHLQS